MNLLFVCTSLEPGRDGVGDYARLLASGCADFGHACALLAINDEHLGGPVVQETQTTRGHRFPTLRLAPNLAWTTRVEHAHAFVQTHAPDWLSWQIVPYGFHAKGIIPDLAYEMTQLGLGRQNHLMLHELWIGLALGEPFKNRVYGFFQRRALKRFIEHLRPVAVDTTNPAYRAVLVREGAAPGILPLCGNIPIEIMPPMPARGEWAAGIFGTIHPQFDVRACVSVLAAGAQASRRKLRVLGFGRVGAHGRRVLTELGQLGSRRYTVEILGERPPDEISRLLQSLDLGIATHPWALIGKSGAVAAMLDHGLPVMVARDDWQLRVGPTPPPLGDPLVGRLADIPSELLAGWLGRRREPKSRLPALASAFLARLSPQPQESPLVQQ